MVVAVCEQGLQTGHKTLHIAVSDIPDEIVDSKRPIFTSREKIGAKKLGESPLHLLIRESETVTIELFVIVLDSQIATLEQQRDRVVVHRVHAVHGAHIHLLGSEPVKRVVGVLQYLHQERRRARGKPEVAKILAIERIQQTERIIHTDRLLAEMVAVIVFLQTLVALVF